MGKRPAGASKRSFVNVRLDPDELALLEKSATEFGLSKSVLLRKLIRACADVGPAMSAGAVVEVMRLRRQTQAIGRNLAQVLHAINAGHAVQLTEAAPLIVTTSQLIQEIDLNALALTEGYGARLRKLANVAPKGSVA